MKARLGRYRCTECGTTNWAYSHPDITDPDLDCTLCGEETPHQTA